MIIIYRQYLEEFRSEVSDGLASELMERGSRLCLLSFSENEEGVWVEAEIELPDQGETWTRRRLIIPKQGPDKDAWLAGTIFSSALVEELDTK
ncbi:hypothetical protein ACWGQ4_00670 [Streptomyces sp. NPDC055721]|uniref:hypothetical protein n=1 Tax=Streptomyces sp. NPDC127132 TaxID=3345374 RepID=UPI003638FD6A